VSHAAKACMLGALLATGQIGMVLAEATTEPAPISTRALTARLRVSGRAEVPVTWTVIGDMADGRKVRRGVLALEPPDRVRLEFPDDGERLTVRSDGGEWLQPATQQMLLLKPEHTAAAAGLWELFLKGNGIHLFERQVGRSRYLLTAKPSGLGLPDSAWITIGRSGLPTTLEATGPSGERQIYRMGGWRFRRPRGVTAFKLEAPPGFEVIALP